MSESPKKKYDMNSPEARALVDEIVHGTFMKEGTMVAFPTCFPGATVEIPGDESHITALTISADGIIYGGTSGRASHLFVGIFHGVTGIVFDRGTVPDADRCTAVCCGKTKFAACVNGRKGGRVITGALEALPFDLIQEWGFSRPPLNDLGEVNGEPIVHAVELNGKLIGTTSNSLFTVDIEAGNIQRLGDVAGAGHIAIGAGGSVFGQDGPAHLWRYDSKSANLVRRAVTLPPGVWDPAPLTWARNHHTGLLYTADAEGRLFSLDEKRGFSTELGRTPLTPVGPMAATHDGRIFGFCGSEMAKMFCYNPSARSVTNLGVALSVIERRRYGYSFGAAVTGRDGQIIFGEDDDLGHLWLYFPRIMPEAAGRG